VTDTAFYASDWLDFDWSDWLRLEKNNETASLPKVAGLYRIRHQHRDGLTYIGQAGDNLYRRIIELKGCYREEMPLIMGNTATPCLWAICDKYGPELEVSYATPDEPAQDQQRRVIRDALIAVYRRETGESPTADFARMISGYKRSTIRTRGGRLSDGETDRYTESGIGPLPWKNLEQIVSESWMGLDWSTPDRLANVGRQTPAEQGVYRIWRAGEAPPLEYIGQSSDLRKRLHEHRRNRDPDLRFSVAVLPDHDAKHKRREAETELIGAHWLASQGAPRVQYKREVM
jgi:hypothetical protein